MKLNQKIVDRVQEQFQIVADQRGVTVTSVLQTKDQTRDRVMMKHLHLNGVMFYGARDYLLGKNNLVLKPLKFKPKPKGKPATAIQEPIQTATPAPSTNGPLSESAVDEMILIIEGLKNIKIKLGDDGFKALVDLIS